MCKTVPNGETIANDMAAVAVDSSHNVDFTNTIFNETLFPRAMLIMSNERNLKNFLLINNCSFHFNMGTSIEAENITDIFIYNSFLELLNLMESF